MQCKYKNESVSSYALHAGASTNYILISIFKYLLDFTSFHVKSYKQLQIYENEHCSVQKTFIYKINKNNPVGPLK